MPSPNLLDLLAQKGAVLVPGNSPSPYVQGSSSKANLTNENATTLLIEIDKINRIVGYKSLREMLQPEHQYFADKKAWVKSFLEYRHDALCENKLLYPVVYDPSRKNPYRKKQLSRSNTGRTITNLMNLRKRFDLDDMRMACPVLTFPRELSLFLSERENGKAIAWRAEKRFWNEFEKEFPERIGMARFVNLHTWKTDDPLRPHFHFHILTPNYLRVENPDFLDENDEPTYELVKQKWYKLNGSLEVPFSPAELKRLKAVWHLVVTRLARQYGLKYKEYRRDAKTHKMEPNINVYVDFVVFDGPGGRGYLVHKFNYQNRHPLEDYCVYSNQNPDCDNPPAWLEGYLNRARVFGWWSGMKSMTRGVVNEKEKLSPITAEPMIYEGRISLVGLKMVDETDGRTGRLGAMDVEKGKPVLYEFDENEMAWLSSVCLSPGADYAKSAALKTEILEKMGEVL